jgi:hypothetical protein
MIDARKVRRVTASGVLLLMLGACSNAADSGESATSASVSAENTDASVDTGAGTEGATEEDQGSVLLGEALAGLGTAYHFVTSVRVGDTVVMTAEGDRIGAGVRLELTTDTGVVSYVVTPDGSWAKPENGTWGELDVPDAATDPMESLVDATAVTLGPSAEGVQQLEVEVPNESLGVPGGGSATVTVQIRDSKVSQVSYRTTVSGQSAEVTTVFGEPRDTSEVVAPV